MNWINPLSILGMFLSVNPAFIASVQCTLYARVMESSTDYVQMPYLIASAHGLFDL